MACSLSVLELVDRLPDEMGFELADAPAHLHARPAVAVGRDAQPRPIFQAAGLLFRVIEHQPLKAVGMAQGGNMDHFPDSYRTNAAYSS